MKRSIRTRAAVGAAGLAAVAAVGIAHAPVSSSAPVSVTLNYNCPFPLIGDQAMSVKISSDIPDTITVGQPTGQFNISAIATVGANATSGLNLVGAKTIEGSALANAGVASPGLNLALKVPTNIAKTNIPASGAFDVTATGVTPSLTFTSPGTVTITVSDLLLTLTPKDANGAATGLGTFDSACTLVAGQNNVLATRQITGGTTTTPPTTAPPTTAPPTTTPPTTAPPTTAPPTTAPPTTAPPTTTPPGGPVKLTYGITGSSNIKAANGNVAITGNIKVDFDLASGTYTSDLTLNPTTGNFTIFGFLPSTAKIEFSQASKTTGQLVAGKLTSSSNVNIKLPNVSLLGLPISTDPACGTTSPSKIDLTSSGTFDPFKGGKLTGTYSIAPLKGCGFFNDIISMVTAGAGNTIELNLTKQ